MGLGFGAVKVCRDGIPERDLMALVGSWAVDEFRAGDGWAMGESGGATEPLDSGPKPKDIDPPEAVLQAEFVRGS